MQNAWYTKQREECLPIPDTLEIFQISPKDKSVHFHLNMSVLKGANTLRPNRLQQTLDLQRSSLHPGLYDKNSKFMPIKKV